MQTIQSGVQQRHGVALNADVVGYSAHIADDRAATIESMRHLQKAITDSVIEAGGMVANFVGDNFLAVFDESTQAITAAISICRATHIRNATLPVERRLMLRLGLDGGEMLVAPDGRCFGDPVNIAARIQALAAPGGINISERVFVDLDEPALRFESLGPQRLKHIPEMITVYRLTGLGSDGALSSSNPDHGTPTVTVMPFESAGKAEEIARALRMDIITALVRLPRLKLLDSSHEQRPAGQEQDVRYALAGGALRSGDRYRVYAKILDVQTVNLVWADRWEGTEDELFELQDRVTNDVTRAFEVELIVGEPARLYRTLAEPAAIHRVYRGWHFLTTGGLDADAWRQAIDHFEPIYRDHPHSAVGPGLLAFTYWYGVANDIAPDPQRAASLALEMAETGIALDDPTGLSHMIKAALLMSTPDQLEPSLDLARAAASRRPTCDITFAVEATIERNLGQWDKAAAAAQRAIKLSPMARTWHSALLAEVHYAAGRYREAADVSQQVVDADPASEDGHLVLAAAQQALGQHRRAAATAALISERFPQLDRDRFRRRHPFANQSIMIGWLTHLDAAGVRWAQSG